MLDKERAISLLEAVNFNKYYIDKFREDPIAPVYADFLAELLDDTSVVLDTYSYYGSRDFSRRLVAYNFIVRVTWEESGM